VSGVRTHRVVVKYPLAADEPTRRKALREGIRIDREHQECAVLGSEVQVGDLMVCFTDRARCVVRIERRDPSGLFPEARNAFFDTDDVPMLLWPAVHYTIVANKREVVR
jgi:hypothetical protein